MAEGRGRGGRKGRRKTKREGGGKSSARGREAPPQARAPRGASVPAPGCDAREECQQRHQQAAAHTVASLRWRCPRQAPRRSQLRGLRLQPSESSLVSNLPSAFHHAPRSPHYPSELNSPASAPSSAQPSAPPAALTQEMASLRQPRLRGAAMQQSSTLAGSSASTVASRSEAARTTSTSLRRRIVIVVVLTPSARSAALTAVLPH